jgi:hypothetical protein
MKYIMIAVCCFLAVSLFGQQKQNQYLLIIRSRSDIKAATADIETNIRHWQEYMAGLGKNGKLAGGYRPAPEGITIEGKNKSTKPMAYISNAELVSSFLVINAADMEEAKQIALKCPVFELQGNVEIRQIQNTAN